MNNQDHITSHIKHEFFCLKSNVHTLLLINEGMSNQVGINYVPSKIFTEAISFELIIKLFYLLDKNEFHGKTHNIKNLFDKLNSESKKLIEKKFNETVVKKAKDFENKIGEKIYIPELHETLSHNQILVMDFKYDSKLKNGSIVNTAFIESLLKEVESRIKNIEDVETN